MDRALVEHLGGVMAVSGTTNLVFRFVPRSVWKKPVEAAAQDFSPYKRDLLRATLEELHNEEIGCPPSMAIDLMDWIGDPAAPATPSAQGEGVGAWSPVAARIQREWLSVARDQASSNDAILLAGTQPSWMVLRVIAPLLEEASRRTGEVQLLSGDNQGSVSATSMKKHAKTMTAQVDAIAKTETGRWAAWWKETALSLGALSQRAAPITHVPQVSDLDRGALVGLPSDRSRVPKRLRLRRTGRNQRSDERGRAKTGGVEGIRLARGLDDLSQMLLSEQMNHPVVLADRIVNSGYLAYERGARRDADQHVLLTGMMDPALSGTAMGAVVRSAWLGFSAQLAEVLIRSRLRDSELRWIEGAAFGACGAFRMATRRLAKMQAPVGPESATRAGGGGVAGHCQSFQWLPDLLDEHGMVRSPAPLTEPWWERAMSLSTSDLRRPGARTANPKRVGFAAHMVILFLPQGGTPWSMDEASFVDGKEIDGMAQLVVVQVPKTLSGNWELLTRLGPTRGAQAFSSISDDAATSESVVRNLNHAWWDALTGVMGHG